MDGKFDLLMQQKYNSKRNILEAHPHATLRIVSCDLLDQKLY